MSSVILMVSHHLSNTHELYALIDTAVYCLSTFYVVSLDMRVKIVNTLCFRRQEEISTEKEEIDKQKKLLAKKRPSETGRKRSGVGAAAGQTTGLHNGTDTFVKPEPVATMSAQEYYEADEILKVPFRFFAFQGFFLWQDKLKGPDYLRGF